MGTTRNINYEFQLPGFAGPLDLLLRLIEKEELAITGISLATVTDQYLAHLSELEKVDPGAMAEFMAIAARLLLIKSEALLPQPPRLVGDEESAAEELARQLMEYRRLKEAINQLQAWEGETRQVYNHGTLLKVEVAVAPEGNNNGLSGVVLSDLVGLLQRRLQLQLPLTPTGPPPPRHTVTLQSQAQRIYTALQEKEVASFNEMLVACGTRHEIIVFFMAVLELWRRDRINIEQNILFSDIILSKGEGFSAGNSEEIEES